MNTMKLLGAALILGSSVWTGFHSARRLRRMDAQLRELSAALKSMECEVAYTSTRFTALCRQLAEASRGEVRAYFAAMAECGEPGEGASRQAGRVSGLVLPEAVDRSMERLMDGFGAYDLSGQLKLIGQTRTEVAAEEERLRAQLDGRCRSYELLGLCTGAAVLILVI